ncbi:hypothetical protein GOP47_0002261 [Adiantum capillus-veneris]|uniref:Uncharacterized protein n=1 Tax=Adiantum capillus-veneris TaxID=13818 RepID=A0A9D4VBE6_ADICA|nr:hypothetical protein GOP47_0002261 [Adiantum capillus-veneris]
MALHSWWCLFPASGHANAIQLLNEGSSCQFAFSHRFSGSSSFSKGKIAKGMSCQNLHRTNSTRETDADTSGECAEAQLDNLRETCRDTVRRALVAGMLAALLSSGCIHFDNLPSPLQSDFGVGAAHASLVQMPPESLNNRYYLVRSGESEFESIGIINTNPVTKTNVESGLSEIGKKQTVKAALQLKEMGACDGSCWIWPSITQRAYQAAEIIAYVNNINRSRIVPEYSFLDARGLGAYEGRSLSYLSKVYEVDAESPNLRPPPYTDGTPNESVADVFVRVTQLMSILETQYFAENIIIVAPDSDNLSVLQAALTGLDLRRHSTLAFVPGEVRYVDLDSRSLKQIIRSSGLLKCKNSAQCG